MIVSRPPLRVTRASRVHKADSVEADLANAIAQALNRIIADLPAERIQAVLAAATASQAADAVARLASLAPGLAELREAAERALGPATARAAVSAAERLGFSYEVSPQRALLWARSAAGDLVVGVGQNTRSAIRAAVVHSLEAGQGIPETAKALRRVVGLHPAWAAAVARTYQESLAGGASKEVADRVAGRQRDRLLRRRSENIARTELIRATNEGSHAAWATAVGLGVFGDQVPVREWLTASDGRTCPQCQALSGVQVEGLDSEFPGGVVMSPLHSSCRCRIVIANDLISPAARKPTKVDPAVRKQIAGLKQDVRDRADAVRADAIGTMDQLDVLRMTPPPRKVRGVDALGRTVWRRGAGGEWDWFDSLNENEQWRLSRNWFSDAYGTSAPDQIAQHFVDHGAAADHNEAIEKWLDLTRRHDAALAVRKGKLPSERVFGNFDVDGTFGDGTYRVADVLNPSLPEAARAIAITDQEQGAEFAHRVLSERITDLPPPWDLTQANYVEELTELEDLARFATPTGGDAEFGFTYGAGDQRTFARLRELAPPELELDPDHPLSAGDLWAVIQREAKLAGLR